MQWLQDAIGGPRECLGVDSVEAYTRKVRAIRRSLNLPPDVREAVTPQPAHVSDGRWVFDCPCGSAGLASVEWGVGICVDCGSRYPVIFPATRATAEAILLARPSPLQRHFWPVERKGRAAETLLGLARENRGAGDPIVKRPEVA